MNIKKAVEIAKISLENNTPFIPIMKEALEELIKSAQYDPELRYVPIEETETVYTKQCRWCGAEYLVKENDESNGFCCDEHDTLYRGGDINAPLCVVCKTPLDSNMECPNRNNHE